MEDEPQTIELFENVCCVCFVPFWQERRGRLRRTCSHACRQELYRIRRGEKRKQARRKRAEIEETPTKGARLPRIRTKCPVCGEPIAQPAHGRKRKTCSERCRKRLWRRTHPRCLMCGKRFRLAKWRKDWKYCSKHCRWKGIKMMARARRREKAWAKVASYRPFWMPRKGSGYRKEVIPWEAGEEEAVVREREPKPNYRREYETEEERLAARAAEWAAELKQMREESERIEKARRLAQELLEDDTKWWRW